MKTVRIFMQYSKISIHIFQSRHDIAETVSKLKYYTFAGWTISP